MESKLMESMISCRLFHYLKVQSLPKYISTKNTEYEWVLKLGLCLLHVGLVNNCLYLSYFFFCKGFK